MGWKRIVSMIITHPETLLTFRGHEAFLLFLLSLCRGIDFSFETLTDLFPTTIFITIIRLNGKETNSHQFNTGEKKCQRARLRNRAKLTIFEPFLWVFST